MKKQFAPALSNLHDSTLLRLGFIPEHSVIEMQLEEEVGGKKRNLRFRNVSAISLGELVSFSNMEMIELNGITVTPKGFSFRVEFIFLLGVSKPSWTISFDFEDLEFSFLA